MLPRQVGTARVHGKMLLGDVSKATLVQRIILVLGTNHTGGNEIQYRSGGTQGAQGVQGATGAQGATGPQGVQGGDRIYWPPVAALELKVQPDREEVVDLLELKVQPDREDHREFKEQQVRLVPVAALELKVQPDREGVVDLLDLKAQLDREEVLDRKAFKGLTEVLALKEPLDLKAPQAQVAPVPKELLELKVQQAQAVPVLKELKAFKVQLAQVVPVLKELKAFKEPEALKEHKVLVEAAVDLQTTG